MIYSDFTYFNLDFYLFYLFDRISLVNGLLMDLFYKALFNSLLKHMSGLYKHLCIFLLFNPWKENFI